MPLNELKQKILALDNELDQSYQVIEQLLSRKAKREKHVYCLFTYSMILNHMQGSQNLVMGNFLVKNASQEALAHPTILLTIESETDFNFTSKYLAKPDQQASIKADWERVLLDDFDPNTHYCFKYIQQDNLPPDEQITFSNFQLIIPQDASIKVAGFTYFNQSNDAIPSLNTIDISI